jgi:hypothetical protein
MSSQRVFTSNDLGKLFKVIEHFSRQVGQNVGCYGCWLVWGWVHVLLALRGVVLAQGFLFKYVQSPVLLLLNGFSHDPV